MFSKFAMNLIISAATTAVLFGSFTSARAGDSSEENADRVVDQAAVGMENEADQDLSLLVKRYKGTKQEPEMLLRLSELRLEIAGGLFRVAYGPGETGLKKAYLGKLSSGTEALSRIITAYPKSEQYPRALFLRGKARKEMAQAAPALKDLESFIAAYPNRSESPIAALAIADLSITNGHFSRAVSVLANLAGQPKHELFLNALSKRAWALQADGKPQAAAAELSRLAESFKTREKEKTLSAGDQALRAAVQSDVPGVAYMAHQQDPHAFTLNSVNALFLSFDTGEGYQKMALRFADHLRTADLNADLRAWKAIVLKSDPSKKSLEMLIGIFEYDLDRDAYADFVKDAADVADLLVKNPENPEAEHARKLAVRGAEKLTKRITDYRKTVQSSDAEKFLGQLFVSFDRMTAPTDARRFALRWNLAENHFALEQYGPAASTYRWVATNLTADAKSPAQVSPKKARLQAIESRYQWLRATSMIPQSLEARANVPMMKDETKIAALREFIAWIAESEKMDGASLEHYSFDADRSLYQAGFQDEAMARAKSLAMGNPSSKLSVGAASLVVDTWIARKAWDKVEAEARDFANVKDWASKTFGHEMLVQAAAAKFKRAELALAAKDYALAGAQAREFRVSYPKSNLSLDAMGIACNSDLSLGLFDQAANCFMSLAAEFPKTKAARQALRTAARIEDDRLHFAAAAKAYTSYLNSARAEMTPSESFAVRKRILLLARAEGVPAQMEAVSNGKKFCAPRLEKECALNLALSALIRNNDSSGAVSAAYSRMERGAPELRSIWATLALEHSRYSDPRSVDRAFRTLTQTWKSTDPSIQYFLIARLTKSIPAILERDRSAVKSIALLANEALITRRMRALKVFESRADLVLTVPVNAVRAASENSLFLAYSDLIADLRAIPAPKGPNPGATAAMTAEQNRLIAGFVQPFVLKSRKIRDAALTLELMERQGLGADSIGSLWDKPISVGATNAELRSVWAKAIRDGNWSRVAFLSSEAADMKNVPANWAKAARAITLSNAGAASEAKSVLIDACRDTTGSMSLRDACRIGVRSAKGRG